MRHPAICPGPGAGTFALRSLVDRACMDVITRFGRALGPTPYATDTDLAQRIADLQVYIRQTHAEADEVTLARLFLDEVAGG